MQKTKNIGAFEVSFHGKKIFSKLKLGVWPNSVKIIEKIKAI